MEIRIIEGSEGIDINDDDEYSLMLTKVGGRIDHNLIFTGKELKRIVELINTFNKIQDNPAPIAGLGNMLDMLKNFGGKK